jgi:GAF domain-containing protein
MSDALAWAILGSTVAVLALLFFAAVVRERRIADRRFEAVAQELTRRMGEMTNELRAALERSQDDDQRARFLGELAGTIDLDEVLARVLEAAGAIRGVDAALVTIASTAGEEPIVVTVGLSTEEAEAQAVAGPPDGRVTRAVSIAYEYPAGADANGGELIRHGLAVPIPGETSPIGYLVVFSRSPGHAFGEEEKRSIEDLASRAGPAIENARRFREARQLADLDALTGLHNRRYFHETLAREIGRASCRDRVFNIV